MNTNDEMTDEILAFYRKACGSNPDAFEWLVAFSDYLIAACALIEDKTPNPERLLRLFGETAIVYTMPFYAMHGHQLTEAVQSFLSRLQTALEWQHSPDHWKREWSESQRLAMPDIVLAVARICIGFDEAQKLAVPLREIAQATVTS